MLKLKDEKMTASIKCNVMSIVHGTSKGSVYKLCLTEKFWLWSINEERLLTGLY